jgi:hypothetical protein
MFAGTFPIPIHRIGVLTRIALTETARYEPLSDVYHRSDDSDEQ